MPVQTNIKWKDFIWTVEKLASERFTKYDIINKSGSGRRIELFDGGDVPCEIFVVHEDKVVWSEDLKKACRALKVDKKEFIKIAENR